MSFALLSVLVGVLAAAPTGRVWHFTDIHVDPIYSVGSNVFAYCNGKVGPAFLRLEGAACSSWAPVPAAASGQCRPRFARHISI